MCAEMMDLSRDEAKRILRRLELEAYSSIVSTFRAQGDLSRDKKKILHELGSQLSISTERHRAEVRRAHSDDRLGIVAECIYGPGSCAEWAAEGRRLVPLMPRLVPQTVFSATATAAANSTAAANAKILASSKAAGKTQAQGTKVVSGKTSSNSITPSSSISASSSSSLLTSKSGVTRQVSSSGNSESYDDDNKPKKRRRLSVTSPKTVQKVPVTSVVVKPLTFTKTATVSTMTKVGKPSAASVPPKVTPKGTLPASASQVKLLTKTVAITQTVCQAKTLLNYKTMTTTSPSTTVKAQSVMTNTTPKSQVKVAVPSATPVSKVVMVAKSQVPSSPSGSVTSKTTQGTVSKAAGSMLGIVKPTITSGQLASKQRGKHVPSTRFKPLPGTVKFKSVTPATMGTSSTVTMVTPSPKSSAASLPVSSTQPVVRLIQVPTTGGVGASKPLVVMTTGLPKATASGTAAGRTRAVQPTSGTEKLAPTSMATSQPTVKLSASSVTSSLFKSVSLSQMTKPTAQLATTSPKTVLLTTMVGGNKKVMLSVPASCSTALSKSIAIAPPPSTAPVITPLSDVQPQVPPIQDQAVLSLEPVPPLGISCKPLAVTSTTQARSRALPTLLPAPPKISLADLQAGQPPGGLRKLATILPAPAKVSVIPTMLVPVVSSSTTTQTGLVLPSVPMTVSPAISTAASVASTPVVEEKQVIPLPDDTAMPSKEKQNDAFSREPATLFELFQQVTDDKEVTEAPAFQTSSEAPVVESNGKGSKSEPNEQSVIDVDNNTSSEDDSLLLCSETIDSASGLPGLSPILESYKTTGTTDTESTPFQTAAKPAPSVSDLASEPAEERGPVASDAQLEPEVPFILSQDSIKSDSLTFHAAPEHLEQPLCSVTPQELEPQPSQEDREVERAFSAASNESRPSFSPVSIGSTALCSDSVEKEQDEALRLSPAVPESDAHIPEGSSQIIHNAEEEEDHIDKELPPREDSKKSEEDQILRSASVCSGSSSDISTGELIVTGEANELQVSQLSTFSDSLWESFGNNLQDSLSTTPGTFSGSSSSSTSVENKDLSDKELRALEAMAGVRTSGRKRKPPTMADTSPSRQVNSWVRGALSLLQKVSTYRGQGRRKGNFSAASWFLKPVDPVDAPGYHKIVKLPMDFGTIKNKLECGEYPNYSDFDADMKLIKSNCYKYNPPGHEVRQDCDEVFRFYEAEYAKMIERWEKCHVSPAKKAKLQFPKAMEGSINK